MRILVLVLVLLLLLPVPMARAQVAIDAGVSGADEPTREGSAPNRVAEFLAGGAGGAGPVVAEGMEPYLDEAGRVALQDSLTAYYRYRESGYAHRRAVFDWQLFSSKIIFYVVILLVLLGVYFSWLQFMSEHRRPARRVEVEVEGAEGERPRGGLLTTFKAGSGGLEVSSPVLGIVILAISLAFFYLYLTHVYPINEVF